jgi:predicted O-methyltransferase YrrM
LKQAGWIRSTYLTRFSQPAQDRVIYQTLCQKSVKSVLEIGIAAGVRTGRIIELALTKVSAGDFRYAGIDLFEARGKGQPCLTLKQAHQMLTGLRIAHRLVPGDPQTALARSANNLGPVDLVIISADQDPEATRRAWFYLPRLLHADSLVLLEERQGTAEPRFRVVKLDEVKTRADAANPARRQAA